MMKKTVPFEILGPNQYLMFDVVRLAALNRSLGIPIQQLIATGAGDFDFVLTALPIAMQQHYFNKPMSFWAEKISKHIEEDGGEINDFAVPLIQAIFITGLLGSELQTRVMEALKKQSGAEDDAEKNAEGTTSPSQRSKTGSTGRKR